MNKLEEQQKEFCERYGITMEQFRGEAKIPGSLDLRNAKAIPQGFNPTVGGWLDLGSVEEIPQGFNPTVGGSLYLPEQFRHMVNNKQKPDFSKPFEWLDGKFILADGIILQKVKTCVFRVPWRKAEIRLDNAPPLP